MNINYRKIVSLCFRIFSGVNGVLFIVLEQLVVKVRSGRECWLQLFLGQEVWYVFLFC